MCVCRPEVRTPFCGRPGCWSPPSGYQPTGKLDTSDPPNAKQRRTRQAIARIPWSILAKALGLPDSVEVVGIRPTVNGFDPSCEIMLSGAGLPQECERDEGLLAPEVWMRWHRTALGSVIFDGFDAVIGAGRK